MIKKIFPTGVSREYKMLDMMHYQVKLEYGMQCSESMRPDLKVNIINLYSHHQYQCQVQPVVNELICHLAQIFISIPTYFTDSDPAR